MDRALGFEPRGWGFKSLRVRHLPQCVLVLLFIGALPQTAVSDLAHLPGELCPAAGLDRLLHRAHHPIPGPLHIPGFGPFPTPHLELNVTAHPTADWTEAFPCPTPAHLLRDRDAIFGDDFREHVRDTGICEVLSAPRSPRQRAYIERVIGSIRRECLDHMIVFHETSLRRTLTSNFDYYHRSRTHLSLGKDSPEPRAIYLLRQQKRRIPLSAPNGGQGLRP
jgi:hypothetical protein